MNKILVIGDCHVDDEQNLDRFDIASDFIMEHRPEHIVIIGDFLTLNCLSAWDKNKRKRMEGKRYHAELKAGNEALDRLFSGIKLHNKLCKRRKSKQYRPNIIYMEGNHEDRLYRYFDYDPVFEGTIDIPKDLKLKERNIEYIKYRNYYYIGGVGFTHVPFNKVGAISGVDITRKAQMVGVNSCVFGHIHEQHLSHVHKEGMPHLQDTYCCGCFISKKEDYVHGRVTNYWRGLTLIHNFKEGRFDIEAHSLGRMERTYGKH